MASIVILGTGLAGYTLAREIRKLDQVSNLTLITADDGDAYPKPMLSTALAQHKSPDQLINADAETMSRQLQARILTRTFVTAVDTARRKVVFEGGSLTYDKLIFALGAHPIRPPMAGDAADEVLSVNDLGDYRVLRQRLEQARDVVIIGPGLIGCEFANDLIGSGRKVALIGPDPHPISTLIPEAAGKALQSSMAAAGAEWHLGVTATSVSHHGDGQRIELSDGTALVADLVLSAIGLRPATELAAQSGLDTARGIVTDRYLECSVPGIYALGDCAEIAGLNLPFVQPIMLGARALAKTLSGTPTEVDYPAMPVVIKTPLHPIVTAPPARGAAGDWHIQTADDGIKALFESPEGALLGFTLTGAATAEKQVLSKRVPPLL